MESKPSRPRIEYHAPERIPHTPEQRRNQLILLIVVVIITIPIVTYAYFIDNAVMNTIMVCQDPNTSLDQRSTLSDDQWSRFTGNATPTPGIYDIYAPRLLPHHVHSVHKEPGVSSAC